MRLVGFTAAVGAFVVVAAVALLSAAEPGRPRVATPVAGQPRFEFRVARVTDDTAEAVRYETATGRSWLYRDRWSPVAEPTQVPPGDYEVVLETGPAEVTAWRFDRATGRTWRLDGEAWAAVPEVR